MCDGKRCKSVKKRWRSERESEEKVTQAEKRAKAAEIGTEIHFFSKVFYFFDKRRSECEEDKKKK